MCMRVFLFLLFNQHAIICMVNDLKFCTLFSLLQILSRLKLTKSVDVDWLFIAAPIVCGGSVFDLCFIIP